MVDFIGIGAQKAGTSWIYACLYEHPEICAPIKEIHFFSRPRFEKGKDWYENHFRKCKEGARKGEFSTSYLYSADAPERIKKLYPEVKLIAVLRNPVERAFSQYRNAIKAGHVDEAVTFDAYIEREESALAQGEYSKQLKKYLEYFDRNQMLILIYEDSRKDPDAFIESIYTFLGVDTSFKPSMLHSEVNVARTPKHVGVERIMHYSAESLRKIGFDRMVWFIRKSGLPDLVRTLNTKRDTRTTKHFASKKYVKYFREDAKELRTLIGRDVEKEWELYAE